MKKLASLFPGPIKLPMLKRHLAQSVAKDGGKHRALIVVDPPTKTNAMQVSLQKRDQAIEVGLNLTAANEHRFDYRMLYARLPAALRIFARSGTKVQSVTADLCGNPPAGGLAFCSTRDDVILIPDPVFVNSGGYAAFRRSSAMLPWSEREDTVLWRGTSTGRGDVTTETMRIDDTRIRQRVRMCLRLRSVPGTDVKIRKTEGDARAVDRERLAREGLFGGKIKQAMWGRYKFAIDVDGYTSAWSNLFIRLLLGCCVIKIQSEHGFRQWYYDKLEPWRHYVPVRADMADLIEKIEWCHGHDRECAEIASAGRAFAEARTIESEMSDAVGRLDAAAVAFDSPEPRSAR